MKLLVSSSLRRRLAARPCRGGALTARLAQDSVEADVDVALKQAYRRQALQDKLRQYSYRFTGEVEGALSGAGRE